VALSLCPLLSRQLIVCNPTPRNTPERLSEPILLLSLSLVEPESLLVLEASSSLQAGGGATGVGEDDVQPLPTSRSRHSRREGRS